MQNGSDGFYVVLSLIARRFVRNKYADCGENQGYAGYWVGRFVYGIEISAAIERMEIYDHG
jgi:hypothetical protein